MARRPSRGSDWVPLVINVVIFLLLLAAMAATDAFAYMRRIKNPQIHPLHDLIHDWIPAKPDDGAASGFVGGIVGAGLLIFLAHPRRIFLLRRLLIQWNFMLAFRILCVLFTQYPDADADCAGEDPLPNLTLATAFFKSCGDMLFSGHTTAMITVDLTLWFAFPWRTNHVNWVVHVVFGIATVYGLYEILATRLHWSDDVIVAIIVSIYVWRDNATTFDRTRAKREKDCCLPLIVWCERDADTWDACDCRCQCEECVLDSDEDDTTE